MNQALTPEREAEIRRRREFNRIHRRGIGPAEQYAEDTGNLLAEIDRLRSLLAAASEEGRRNALQEVADWLDSLGGGDADWILTMGGRDIGLPRPSWESRPCPGEPDCEICGSAQAEPPTPPVRTAENG